MSYNYGNILRYINCNICESFNICLWRRVPLYNYPEYVQYFVIAIPRSAFTYQSQTRQWYANYKAFQDQLVQYYDTNNCRLPENKTYNLVNEAQKESDRQKIRELFKQYLDIAAKATEDKNPELSIMFDEIGLVLASDYLEAVGKIFSLFKTMGQIKMNSTNKCGLKLS